MHICFALRRLYLRLVGWWFARVAVFLLDDPEYQRPNLRKDPNVLVRRHGN